MRQWTSLYEFTDLHSDDSVRVLVDAEELRAIVQRLRRIGAAEA